MQGKVEKGMILRLRRHTMPLFVHEFSIHCTLFQCVLWALLGAASTAPMHLHAQQQTAPDAVPPYRQSKLSVDQRVQDLLDRMSLVEKAHQLDMVPIPPGLLTPPAGTAGANPQPGQPSWTTLGIGGILLDAAPANGIQDWVTKHSRLGIPPLAVGAASFANAEMHGAPALTNLCATWNVELAKQAGSIFATRQRALGINSVIFPLFSFTADLPSTLVDQRFGENAWLIGQMGRAYVQGLQGEPANAAHSVMAFPAYFATGTASGPGAKSLQVGERELRMDLLKPFEPVLREGNAMGVVMGSSAIDGVPMATNAGLLKDILRNEWNFHGVVLAAPGSIRGLLETQHIGATPNDTICLALNSGTEMQWNDYEDEALANIIGDCVKFGVVSPETLNYAVGDVLRAKFRMGLFDDPNSSSEPTSNTVPGAYDVSFETAVQSLTLLRNENHLLPLSHASRHIVVIEPPSEGGDAKRINTAPPADTLAEEIQKLLPDAQVMPDDGRDTDSTVSHVKNADVVLIVLRDAATAPAGAKSGKAFQSQSEQGTFLKAILAANENTVIIYESKFQRTLPWAAKHIPAILEAWSPGQSGERAIAAVLVGTSNPAGRLPTALSAAEDAEVEPQEKLHDKDARDHTSEELFPLGYGLSYTTFRYSDLVVHAPEPNSKDDLMVTVVVTNAGKLEGDEVAQLYLHHDVSSVITLDKALEGFQRIHLQPGESRTLTFPLKQRQLAVWNAKRQWNVEPGPYTVFAGGSSSAQLSATFTIGQPAWVSSLPTEEDRWIPAPTLEIKGAPVAEFAEAYQLALRVMEYNLHQGMLEAGQGYGTWTRDSSINSWNAASLLIPEIAKRTLWHEVDFTPDGPLIGGQYWDKVIWILAALHYVQVTGDQPFLKSAYDVSLRTLAAMRSTEYDARTGLFRGPAVYGDGEAAYPAPPFNDEHGDNVFDYSQAADMEVLSTNSVYYGAYRAAAVMGRKLGAAPQETDDLDKKAANLRDAIQHILWMPNLDRFAYLRDGEGRIDSTQEALGEAFAILLGVGSEQQSNAIVRHASATRWGIACTWPPYPRYRDPTNQNFGRHNGTIWPFINAFWATAAASVGESSVFAKEFLDATQLALRSGDFREMYHPYTGEPYGGVQAGLLWDSVRHQTWSATGYVRMVHEVLFGMHFEDGGIRLQPTIPASLGLRSITLQGVHYRQAVLNITITGAGRRILQCKLDGAAQPEAFIPATLAGKHDVEVVLSSIQPAPSRSSIAKTPVGKSVIH